MRQSSLSRVFHFRGSLLSRIHGDREPVSLLLFLLAISEGDTYTIARVHFFSFFFFFLFFRHDFIRAISLEPLLADTPNSVYCLVLRSNFALLLTIQLASLISLLINIISLLLTTFDWTKVEMRRIVCIEFFIFGGSLLGRIQGDREPVSLLLLLLAIRLGDAIWDCRVHFFFFFLFFLFFRHDFVRAISLEPLLAETPN